jgi:hypothetical protein
LKVNVLAITEANRPGITPKSISPWPRLIVRIIRIATRLAAYREAKTARMKMIFSGNVSTASSLLIGWVYSIEEYYELPKARWEVYHSRIGAANSGFTWE